MIVIFFLFILFNFTFLTFLFRTEEELKERYRDVDDDMMHNDNFEPNDLIGQQGRQPSISDPKLWLVKCKQGKEKECVQSLFHKYFSIKDQDKKIK